MRPRFLILVLVSLLLTPPPPASAQEQGGDARIRVAVDSILRSDTYPEGLLLPTQRAPRPEAGNDYCVIFLTFTQIRDTYVQHLGGRDAEKSLLRDAEGHTHPLGGGQVRGMEFLDSHDIRSPSWVVEGATATLIFQIPQDAEPESLLLRYYFKDALEDESTRMGEVDIQLGTG